MIRLLADGLTITEIAPGIDLERDIRERVAIPLHISPDLRIMDERLFCPEPMQLCLREHSRNSEQELAVLGGERARADGRA